MRLMADASRARSWWHLTTHSLLPSPVDRLPSSVSVAIVGGGMMGFSLARWLTDHGIQPLVLERRQPGCAASGRNGGLVVVGASAEYLELAEQLGPKAAAELIQGSLENHALMRAFLEERGLASAWTEAGFLALYSSETEREFYAENAPPMNQLGWRMELLDRRECERVMGTRLGGHFLGGVWTPGDAVVQPVTYTNALAVAAHHAGAQVAYATEVLALTRDGLTWSVTTSRGSLFAEHVVLAVNERTPVLLPECGPFFRTVRDTVAVTEPSERPIRASWAEHSVAPYGRSLNDGRMLFGGFAHTDRTVASKDEPVVRPADVQARLSRYLASAFPDLSHLRVAHAWTGALGLSSDRLPLVGPWPNRERLWLLAGFGGQGIPLSQWAPRVLAEAIANADPGRVPGYLSPRRFFV